MHLHRMAMLAGIGAAIASPVAAADAISISSGAGAEIAVAPVASAFDWSGFYGGVYGVGQVSSLDGTHYGLGAVLGANATFDFVLLGAEVAVQGLTGGAADTAYVEALGRAGVLVSDNVLAYGALGFGTDLGASSEDDLLVGGGVELAVTDSLSLRAQYLHGFPLTGGNQKDQVTLGANFHF